MDVATARWIAHVSHSGQHDRHGVPLTDHVERVAEAVGPEARTIAYLHDVLERTDTTVDALRAQGLTPLEETALALLTRNADESYELYVLRIVHAAGAAGELAREVKRADLDQHVEEPFVLGAPPYAWARRRLLPLVAQPAI